ncbi:uncharacterized protein LOC111624995 [Centruroides sculpturatus]|uniref:uncharacterized protein LOC111624669 n=1 Tax=Centruroides sculpturatus TaxID=218467 RepID=UPI000C6CFB42|nr:uncharacterized protein LOC111624669 [Centruroides sculpturatus]XP_023223773.1 uncharacterized protein LOC111624995 [Centruroides sculpturatus]
MENIEFWIKVFELLLFLGGIELNPGPVDRTPPQSQIQSSASTAKRHRSPSEPSLKTARLEDFFPSRLESSKSIPREVISYLEDRFDKLFSTLNEVVTKIDWLANLHNDHDRRLTQLEVKLGEFSKLKDDLQRENSLILHSLDKVSNEMRKKNILIKGLTDDDSDLNRKVQNLFYTLTGESRPIPMVKVVKFNRSDTVLVELQSFADKKLIFANLGKKKGNEALKNIQIFDDLCWRSRLRRRKLLPFLHAYRLEGRRVRLLADVLQVASERFTYDLARGELLKLDFLVENRVVDSQIVPSSIQGSVQLD